MRKIFVLTFVLVFAFSFSYGEIVVVEKFKGTSFVYPSYTTFFSEVLLSIYGGNKYGAGIVISPSSSSNFQDVQINLEKIEFFTKPFDFLGVYLWYGVRKYLGYEATYQGYTYHPSKEFSFRGWRRVAGTGVDLDFSFFEDKLGISIYVYRSFLTNEGGFSSDLEFFGVYRDIFLSGFLGISEAALLRGGFLFKTLFKTLNAVFVLGVDGVHLTNLVITTANVYALGEEKVSISSFDNSWGVEQIFSVMFKPQFYNGFVKPSEISDLDIRLTGVLRFLYKVLLGAEGIMYMYNLTGSVTQVYIDAWVSPVVGIFDNRVVINVKPSFLILTTRTNEIQELYRVVLSGEVRF